MKKNYIISPIYLLAFLDSVYSQQDIHAGFWINFENQKNCTASFVVNKQGINGFLTSAQCCVNNNCLNGNVFDTAYENEDDGNVTKIGQIHDAQFGGANGLDYAFVSLDLVDWKPFQYTTGLTADDDSASMLYPITASLAPTGPGLAVCAYGQGSGYLCGNLTALDLHITVDNPWIKFKPTVLKVNKVDLGAIGFESQADIGGPVYVQNNSGGVITSQALGHIVATNNDDPQHKFLYYMPIDKVLTTAINTELLIYVPEKENNSRTEIKYLKWNDTIDTLDVLDQEKKKIYVYAGQKINIKNKDNSWDVRCTTNFAVKNNGQWSGMLTAGHCVAYSKGNNDVFLPVSGRGDVLIGRVKYFLVGDNSNDYSFIEADWDVVPVPCIAVPNKGWIWDSVDYLAVVVGYTSGDFIGKEVCAVGFKNGKVCGTVAEVGGTLRMRYHGGVAWITDVVGVNTGFFGAKLGHGDSGGPVYSKVQDRDDAANVHGIISSIFPNAFYGYFAYTPLWKVLDKKKNGGHDLSLLTSEVCPKSQTEEKYEAQVEIPTKK